MSAVLVDIVRATLRARFLTRNVPLCGTQHNGSFIIKKRAEKVARNISKNTTITIPAHNISAFKPAKSFAEEVK